jgi:hypothetical protein
VLLFLVHSCSCFFTQVESLKPLQPPSQELHADCDKDGDGLLTLKEFTTSAREALKSVRKNEEKRVAKEAAKVEAAKVKEKKRDERRAAKLAAKDKEMTADKDKALEDAMNSRFGDEKETKDILSKGKGAMAARSEAKAKRKAEKAAEKAVKDKALAKTAEFEELAEKEQQEKRKAQIAHDFEMEIKGTSMLNKASGGTGHVSDRVRDDHARRVDLMKMEVDSDGEPLRGHTSMFHKDEAMEEAIAEFQAERDREYRFV